MVRTVDALIVGAGPAGSTTALNLASTRSVLLVDARHLDPGELIVGESLVPAARRLLDDMGILKSLEEEGHKTCYGNRSVWGNTYPMETDHLRDPDGTGWHLDRSRFDQWLREMAVSRGTSLQVKVTVQTVDWDDSKLHWQVCASDANGQNIEIHARILIDATGRHAPIARRLGAVPESSETRMVCSWLNGFTCRETPATAGFTFIEAVEDGWWYTAPLPADRRILAFYTNSEHPAARLLRSEPGFLSHSLRSLYLGSLLKECGFFSGSERIRMMVSSGGRIRPSAGRNWFAIGDAAIHFDPISSQGLFSALFTGLAAAEAADRILSDEYSGTVSETYTRLIDGIEDAYFKHLDQCYASEQRWPEHPFWARRRMRDSGRRNKMNDQVVELETEVPTRTLRHAVPVGSPEDNSG